MGSETALMPWITTWPRNFSRAVSMTAPTLILIGEADERNPVERCREMVAHARPDGAPIALTVYPGVHHNFDVALLTPGVRYRGFWLEYNESAAKDAEKRRAHSSTLISPRHLPASRRQSEKWPHAGQTLLIAALARC
jgi:dienelactone hydrolase